jgi:hypothetical protein
MEEDDEIIEFGPESEEWDELPQCVYCVYYLDGGTCKAFHKEIPDEIWSGKFDHTKPYLGDHGIQFVKCK